MDKLQSYFRKFYDHSQILQVCPGKLTCNSDRPYFLVKAKDQVLEDSDERTFQIYFKNLEFTKAGIYILKNIVNSSTYIKLRSRALKFDENIATISEILEEPDVQLESFLKIPTTVDLVEKLKNRVDFSVGITDNVEEINLAVGSVLMYDVIQAENDLFATVKFTRNLGDETKQSVLAVLNMWYLISDDESKMTTSTTNVDYDRISRVSVKSIRVSQAETDNLREGLVLALNRNKVLKTKQEDITNELEERVRWLKQESNWKRTLQENAILRGEDPDGIIWRQWRTDETSDIWTRNYTDDTVYKPEFSIKIVRLILDNTFLSDNPVEKIYIDFKLLNREGPEMESRCATKIHSNEFIFDYEKIFLLRLQKDKNDCQMVSRMIKRNEVIKISVINEPFDDPPVPLPICKEIGYCMLSLYNVIKSEKNLVKEKFHVYSDEKTVVGDLEIAIDGVQAIRNTALYLLSPLSHRLTQVANE